MCIRDRGRHRSRPPTPAAGWPSDLREARMPSAPIAPRPLIITPEAELLDELVRLAAAAGVEPEVAPDAVAARRQWTAAPMVLVGTDATAGCAVAAMPRRRN